MLLSCIWSERLATGLSVERASAPTVDIRELVDELEAVLGAEYPPEQRHGLSLAQLFRPEIRFFVARLEGAAVGCGGVELFDSYAEVKRMYSRPAARGRGVGKALLECIEREARAAGKPVLRLETGTRQAAAVGLYEARGFRPCAAFGRYAEMPAHTIATSLFYEKPL